MPVRIEKACEFALLVPSCDKYSDLWKPFFESFWRFWPDCPFDVFLSSNNLRFDHPSVHNLLIGEDRSWSESIRRAVSAIEREFVVLFLDDIFLTGTVDSSLASMFIWIRAEKPAYVRLLPRPRADLAYNSMVGGVSRAAPYRTATHVVVWKKSVLLELLHDGEDAWQFENAGSIRSAAYDGFYATEKRPFSYVHGCVKGKWTRPAIRQLQELGIQIDRSARPVLTHRETAVLHARAVLHALLNHLPPRPRAEVRRLFRRDKHCYARAK